MNDTQNAKQQIVERIKTSSTVLVTVSTNPSVDELSAALGLTMMLNGMEKHATAVVSGKIPPAIEFLEPGKTFENTVDSLRDFIIALDKEKADHLRYKVDGDVVKIFITPYRTTINEKDLDFSQGDYNVELVLALGVLDKNNLDKALESHGRILHDATVATLSCGENPSKLGSIDWFESSASSISEMLVSLSESLKGDTPVLNEQVSTALLTGIVAATDRFSNNRTSSRVMTMAAQLMAAGANQQLIAAKLQEAREITSPTSSNSPKKKQKHNGDGTTDLSEGSSTKLDRDEGSKDGDGNVSTESDEPKQDNDGSLAISHERQGSVDEVAEQVQAEKSQSAAETAENALADQLESASPSLRGKPSVEDLQSDIAAASDEYNESEGDVLTSSTVPDMPGFEPTLGGTLNATTEQAADEKRREDKKNQNHTILNHGNGEAAREKPLFADSPFTANSQQVVAPEQSNQSERDYSHTAKASPVLPLVATNDVIDQKSSSSETLADIDQNNRVPHDDARAAVHAALDAAPFSPSNNPVASIGAQPFSSEGDSVHSTGGLPALPDMSTLPPLPDFSTLPPPPPVPSTSQSPQQNTYEPEQLGEILGQTPPPPPSLPTAPEVNDPGQFKIPGQN